MNLADEEPGLEKSPEAVERHLGERLRLARKALRLSQEALAERLGVTFQQVQKYEKGINRISASRLHHAAAVLDVPVSFFFPETDGSPGDKIPTEDASLPETVVECLNRREGIELITAFARINDPKVRRHILQLVNSLAAKSVS